MALIPIDDRELLKLLEMLRCYEHLVELLLPRCDGTLCMECHEVPRVGFKYCAECKVGVQNRQRRASAERQYDRQKVERQR